MVAFGSLTFSRFCVAVDEFIDIGKMNLQEKRFSHFLLLALRSWPVSRHNKALHWSRLSATDFRNNHIV